MNHNESRGVSMAKIGTGALLTAATFVVAQTWRESLTYNANALFDIFICDDDNDCMKHDYNARKLTWIAIVSSTVLLFFISHLQDIINEGELTTM